MKKRLLAAFLSAALLATLPVTARAEESSDYSTIESTEADQTEQNQGDDSQASQNDGQSTDQNDAQNPNEAEGIQTEEETDESASEVDEAEAGVSYRVHVQTYGWQDWKQDGETAGTTGEAKRLEAIELSLKDAPYEGGIEYRTHVQTYGWQDWVSDGAASGTSGKAKRLEAIQIRLTGEMAEHYDVYYRVHAQTYGWLGWAKNGGYSGTASYAKRLEGIEIVLVEKGTDGPASSVKAYYAPVVQYQTHVQTYGWQSKVADGAISGTVGKAKRLEGIKINLYDTEALGYEGGIEYRTHVQTYGWQDWVSDGAMSGTSGEGKRLEAIEIRLTGELAEHYDVYYRVHSQTFGWLGWTKNGESSGTQGFSKRLEGIEICVVAKDSSEAPDTSERAFIKELSDDSIQLSARLMNTDAALRDLAVNGNDQSVGSSEEDEFLESFGMSLLDNTVGGSVQYRVLVQDEADWEDWVAEGTAAGTTDEGKYLEGVQIRLQGTISQLYDVYYRVKAGTYGWLGWTKNGESAGISGYDTGIEAVQVRFVKKGQSGPIYYARAYHSKSDSTKLANPCPSYIYISSEFGYRVAPTSTASRYHKGRDYAASVGTAICAASSGKVIKVDYNRSRGHYLILDHGNNVYTVYQHCSKIDVKVGDSVFVGAKIAEVGTSGDVSGAHLHFEVWEGYEKPVDPRLYLK